MKRTEETRQRILDCAKELFYWQGYQATTVDQVVERSGVSKPTVYKRFPSKEALAVAYLNQRKAVELGALRERLVAASDPWERYLGVVKFIRDALPANDFRGCGFFNIISEIPDQANPAVRVARAYIDEIRAIIRQAVEDLARRDPACAGLDVDGVAEDYYLICCGAIMASQELRSGEPAERAVERVRALVPAPVG